MLLGALGGPPANLGGTELAGARFLVLEELPTVTNRSRPSRPPSDGSRRPAPDWTARRLPVDGGPGAGADRGRRGGLRVWRNAIEPRRTRCSGPHPRPLPAVGTRAADYVGALRELDRQRARLARGDGRIRRDPLSTGTCRLERLFADPDYYIANLLALRNPNLANLLGLSSLTLPAESRAA